MRSHGLYPQGALNLETKDSNVRLEEVGQYVASSVSKVHEKQLSESPFRHPFHLTQRL